MVIIALQHGLGQTEHLLRDSDVSRASQVRSTILLCDKLVNHVLQATFASQVLFILASALAKASTLCLMRRLFNLNGQPSSTHGRSRILWWLCTSMLGGIALWGILSIVALCLDCSPQNFIRAQSIAQCSNQVGRCQVRLCDRANEYLSCCDGN
jgi:hypothetical protein